MNALFKYVWILVRRLLPPLLLSAALLAGTAWWLQKSGGESTDVARAGELRQLAAERAATREALTEIKRRMDRLAGEISAEEERGERAAAIVAKLRELESTWGRFVGNPAQQRANAEQMRKMQRVHDDAVARAHATRQELTRTTWERDARELALTELDENEATVRRETAGPVYFLHLAWRRAKGWLAGAVLAWFVVPPFVRFVRWWRAPAAPRLAAE